MTSTNKESLIDIRIGISFGLAIVLILLVLIQQRRGNEALAKQLIAKFHEQYNSDKPDSTSGYDFLIAARIRSERIQLGRFIGVKHCDTQKWAEPPWLKIECLSSFTNGDGKELFILNHNSGHSHLLVYSVKNE
jgi:hypothetical protein